METARINMVKQQFRACEVLNDNILEIIESTPREIFVPEAYRGLAFADTYIPLPHDQVMMAPIEEGKLLQALNIQADDKILEIGTGSGYLTAILAQCGKFVYSVNIMADFLLAAQDKLSHLNISNVELAHGDAAQGWEINQPYDVIAITGSMPLLPKSFQNSLSVGGRLFAIIGESPSMCATLITRESENTWAQQELFETDIKPLINALHKPRFVF